MTARRCRVIVWTGVDGDCQLVGQQQCTGLVERADDGDLCPRHAAAMGGPRWVDPASIPPAGIR